MPASTRRAEKYAKIRKRIEPAVSPKPEPPGPDCSFVEKAYVGETRRYSPSRHPDALDAFRYGMAAYLNLTKPEDTRSDIEKARARQEDFIRERIARAEAERHNAPDLTDDVAALLGLPA